MAIPSAPLATPRRGDLVVAGPLADVAWCPVFVAFQRLASSPQGLTEQTAADRSVQYGDNRPGSYVDDGVLQRLWVAVRSPFVGLLSVLGAVLAAVGDVGGALTVGVMVTLSVALRVWQQTRSIRAVRGLREQLSTTATVRRRSGLGELPTDREVPIEDLVPGDVVVLTGGDVVPADLRVIASAALLVDQAVLSGESLPVRKHPPPSVTDGGSADVVGIDTPSMCFTGTAVVAGTATALVVATGTNTLSDQLARAAGDLRPDSSFDRGVRMVGMTLIRFMLVMAPLVLVVNGWVRGDWTEATMFAVAVAVGLTPEMLPVIVTANLARGATRLAGERVIVSRLEAIQDLGAMDVLCVDKTGTLTEDRVVYAHSVDPTGRIDDSVGEIAYVAVSLQDCPYNRLDEAVIERIADSEMAVVVEAAFDKVTELSFDHIRRMTTVVVRRQRGEHIMMTHGDPVEVVARCDRIRLGRDVVDLDDGRRTDALEVVRAYATRGMRVLAVATRSGDAQLRPYDERDERGLVLVGFLGFVDPIRSGAAAAIGTLAEHGVSVKVLTGDNEDVACVVATQVGVSAGDAVLGEHVESLDDIQLGAVVERSTVFARLSPTHKARVVAALRSRGHTVGFLGDGVNDVPALRAADAGIAADTATDAAKGAADLILLANDLEVLAHGVLEGRRTLANTMKYVKITASSNFGNVLTVMVAAMFLPFLPILPIQLMVQNLLYDAAQLALPWDRAEAEYLRSPRRWNPRGLVRFMLWFGPLSSMFDLATFAVLWWIFDAGHRAALFHTGWFVEGLLTQLLIVLVLRVRTRPGRGSTPARPVVIASATAAVIGLVIPVTALGARFGLVPLPVGFLPWIALTALGYGLTAELAKRCYLRRHDDWL